MHPARRVLRSPAGILRAFAGTATGNLTGSPLPVLVCTPDDAGLEERVLSGGPAVLRNAMRDWDLSKHSLTVLNSLFADRHVEVEVASGGADYRDLYRDAPLPGRHFQADVPVTLGLLLEHIQQRESDTSPAENIILYLAQKDVAQVLSELAIDPQNLPLKVAGSRLFQQSIWLGPRGTRTPLHCDPYYNLLCQVWGRKHVRVYPPEARAKLHPFSRGVLRNTSQVDTQSRDGPAFPGFQEVSFQEVVLRPGEILYMPPKYWHEVTALEGSMSLSYWWT